MDTGTLIVGGVIVWLALRGKNKTTDNTGSGNDNSGNDTPPVDLSFRPNLFNNPGIYKDIINEYISDKEVYLSEGEAYTITINARNSIGNSNKGYGGYIRFANIDGLNVRKFRIDFFFTETADTTKSISFIAPKTGKYGVAACTTTGYYRELDPQGVHIDFHQFDAINPDSFKINYMKLEQGEHFTGWTE